MAGDIRRHVRVAVTVAAHPGGKTYRHKIHRQFVAEIFFQLFVQFTQIVRYALPQAVLNHGEAPFGFIHRAWTLLADLIRMPGLGNQLAQATHYLVAFVVGDIGIIKLFQTVIDFTHLVNKRTAGNFCRVGG
ncbi:Uncharacterised protein [Salmonella enterica subsp. enterica serovar Bovismorbificans]|uniref:Uncharacterized protein n=1 Tax=Salmonella enterica subsp. enterica serovar Bovismorbificans TaxID=58097 RepID=A0A655C378_SALET|nr:Uncharacterised protein [Salmonella enterica subsp. enterica serovar Bovismorbificans]CNU54715.1 Uncharacterised protein [Salmonella enterica subsp. enterica serovar Bovismorbificans]